MCVVDGCWQVSPTFSPLGCGSCIWSSRRSRLKNGVVIVSGAHGVAGSGEIVVGGSEGGGRTKCSVRI